jgi:N-acetyl-anhydromuramyl-L-alanine amidase AmpD
VNFIQWLNRLFGASANGPAQTSPNFYSQSKPSSTRAPITPPKPSAAKSYPETKTRTPNVSAKPIKPEAIVLHHSGGSYAGGVSWIKNPASRVSYHCLIAKDGRRTVFAMPEQRTWHAGVSSWRGKRDLNSWSIGVAFEGDTNKRELGEAEMASLAEYLAPIMREYRLTVADVTDHRTVSPGRKDDLAPKAFAVVKKYLATRL